MLIQDMTREMSEDLLKRTRVGRLGCGQGSNVLERRRDEGLFLDQDDAPAL